MAKFKGKAYPAPAPANTAKKAASSEALAAAHATIEGEYLRVARVARSADTAFEADRQRQIVRHCIEWLWGFRGTAEAERQLQLWD